MKSPFSVRHVYRLLLRLHPHAFRARFGDEMLWIFDEQSRNGSTLLLLLDGLRSLSRQRGGNRRKCPAPQIAEGLFVEIEYALPARRFLQALSFALAAVLCFAFATSSLVQRSRIASLYLATPGSVHSSSWLLTRINISSPPLQASPAKI
ncbi:MAG: hypothetical protein ABSA39_00615 [Edaphobacter sp.]